MADRRRRNEGEPVEKKPKLAVDDEAEPLTLAKGKDKPAPPAKVSFLSKRQRERQSEKEEKTAREQQKEKENELYQRRKEFLMQEELERERQRERERLEKERERERREEERKREKEEREKMRMKAKEEKEKREFKSSLSELSLLSLPEPEIRAAQAQKEMQAIKNHYLGLKEEKKKMQKPSEKFRNIFNFEWDVTEDTARGDSNPLYVKRVEPQLLFGRGYRAGIDIREQRKANDFYDQLINRRAAFTGNDASTFMMPNNEAALHSRDIEVRAKHEDKVHWTDKTTQEMTARDWKIFREDFEIYIKGGRVPPPMRTWAESPLPFELLEAVRAVGYDRPTPIQMQAIPIAFQQRDLIGIAETGSGKTAAFMLPMLSHLNKLPLLTATTACDGPYGLVMAPSRELVIQIEDEARKFGSYCKGRMISVVGGRNAEAAAFTLREGVELVFATPGRMADSLEKSHTVLHQCNYVVLDEADKMIDMGFETYVNQILDYIPASNMKSLDEDEALKQELEAMAGHRQFRITHMFSATMPPAVERLARKYLRCPAFISVGDPGAGKKSIEQRIEFLSEAQKKKRLEELLREGEPPFIIFVNQKKAADVLCKSLDTQGFAVTVLHGGKTQEQRDWAITSFKEGKYDILVATDVAGRGIDVQGVKQVINFDMAKSIEDYTHRIGRTGRAGLRGLATTFLTEEDSGVFHDLANFLKTANQIIPHELAHHPMTKVKPGMEPKNTNQVVYAG